MSTRTFTFQVTARPSFGSATWIANSGAGIGQWFEIPNTSLSSCPPSQGVQYGNPTAKITAWNGATLRRTGSVYLIGAAGGHADYGGNEVNALVLNTPNPQWVELRPSSTLANMVDLSGTYLDYRRSAIHTYNSLQFINQDDRLAVMPYAGMGESALPDASPAFQALCPIQMMCSFQAVDWTAANPGNDWDAAEIAASPTNPKRGYYANATVAGDLFNTDSVAKCGDPLTGDLYTCDKYYGLWKWVRATDTWSKISSGFPWGAYGQAINLDQLTRNGEPFRRLLFSGLTTGGVYRSDTGALITTTTTGLAWTDIASPAAYKYAGIVYDEQNDRWLVFLPNKPNSTGATFAMYSVKYTGPTTYHIEEVPVVAASGSTAPNVAARNGIHNAVQYVPELKGIVLADQYAANVHFMRVA